MTPLAEQIALRIRATGPMPLSEYMRICLLDSRHGYYATRDPFGRAGDFTTAPEIHQVFGELCGLALAQAWMDQGSPSPFCLAEPGPGRGTLMADMLRAIRMAPGMRDAAQVALIEASAHLRQVQSQRLPDARHLDRVEDLPAKPLFLVANEFIDALPIRQYQMTDDGWRERLVGLEDGALAMGLGQVVPLRRAGQPGDIVEECPEGVAAIRTIAQRIAAHGGAAIIVDYGGWNGYGDSFQALRDHTPEDPLANPGLADLTAHVDFAPLAAAALDAGAQVARPIHQGDWLRLLGIEARAEALTRAGDRNAAAALHRLTDPAEMGHLFKAIAIWPKGAPAVPGFTPLE
ncbi:SAM-dependent methyltransferase [Paracoccus sp. 1_MG-2023]|uniref:class I SAM-dependent methyltransferase n=1 Tax=unclassified Paracoccus (in: a-proteobacteria) TaxID=2688777 RepID=UPI001C0A021D|nr:MULTISPECIES: SAM-dependent methyltransferase [unclassified Paracoccus (in: a-proteobacteria)]MBU2958751.1 SAM-dependent methyltransferase [Paracoccus sp. C2R09]MDO6667744.1 SAM-dependent methyltransferase [Paracoccus sp. 1_MG-2023]